MKGTDMKKADSKRNQSQACGKTAGRVSLNPVKANRIIVSNNVRNNDRNNSSRKICRFPALIAVIIAFLLTVGGGFVVCANNRPTEEAKRQKCYASIEVQPGDSLWSIASKYRSAEYSSMYDYIDEVKEMNHIKMDQITAGTTLMIAYYKTVD